MMSAFRSQIVVAAKAHALDARLLEALVWVESSDKPDAIRYEFEEYQRLKKEPPMPYMAFGPLAAHSYGLLQPLYVTCYEQGFRAEPWKLFVPDINLEWGAKILADRFVWAKGDRDLAVASYNVGKGNAKRPFSVIAQAYLSKVYGCLAQLS